MTANEAAKLAVKRANELFTEVMDSGADVEDVSLEFRDEFLTAISWWEENIDDDCDDFDEDDEIVPANHGDEDDQDIDQPIG